ncbi:MAG TPA: YHS domain-containing protein [Candidatus Thermoplasmatota archaeon]|nr:YHS domain-containing protein [Candidatus Thermoplasmatota archaeon]
MADVIDPVCKMEFPEESAEELGALRSEHKGKRYWFCSPTCQHEFEADPGRYVQQADQRGQ